ncbi:MAG: glycoside hydrolase family protein [Magnetococcales bacterium]|nr:glycoside hydrolase family protein [Magnetococcales bacterium]
MDRNKLKRQLRMHEGLQLQVYEDSVGKLTIGVGRNLEDRGITPDEAMYLLDNDITDFEAQISEAFPWYADLDDVRQRVLVDMGFNLGLAGLKGFRRMLQAVQERRYDDAATEMLASRWAEQVGQRARTLAEMMRSGQDPAPIDWIE